MRNRTWSGGIARVGWVLAVVGLLAVASPGTASAAGADMARPRSDLHSLTVAGLQAPNLPVPELTAATVVDGLTNPWDVAFTPDGTMLFDQLRGGLGAVLPGGEIRRLDADFSDNFTGNESGVMGIAIDPDFTTNRVIYICQTLRGPDPGNPGVGSATSVVRWLVSADYRSATRSGTVVAGIQPANSEGRHVGCRLRFDADRLLYVSIGDGYSPTGPEDITSPLGKVLRMTTAGEPAPSNPFVDNSSAWARLVFTYGHRNPQGLAWQADSGRMWEAEHGPDRDDEVNLLTAGADYGWNPVGPGGAYQDNGTSMTRDGATPAAWSSGFPTIATSGATFLHGPEWGAWDGALAVATLKGVSLRLFSVSPAAPAAAGPEVTLTGAVGGEVTTTAGVAPAAANPIGVTYTGTFGRLRTAQLGPDGALYMTTSNGGGTDRILRIQPGSACAGPVDNPVPSGVAAVGLGSGTAAFVRGADDAVWYRTAQSDWASAGGIIKYGPAVASWDGQRIDLFVVGIDGALYHRVGWPDGSWWPWESLGGQLTASPAVVSRATGTLDIYGRGTDGALWRMGWDGTRWTPWASAGGLLASAPGVAVDPTTARAVVGVRGINGLEYRLNDQTPGGFDGTAVPICSAPAYTVGSDGAVTTAYRMGNGSVAVGVQPIGGVVTSSPAAVLTPGSGEVAVFARGTDNGLWVHSGAAGAWTSWGGVLR